MTQQLSEKQIQTKVLDAIYVIKPFLSYRGRERLYKAEGLCIITPQCKNFSITIIEARQIANLFNHETKVSRQRLLESLFYFNDGVFYLRRNAKTTLPLSKWILTSRLDGAGVNFLLNYENHIICTNESSDRINQLFSRDSNYTIKYFKIADSDRGVCIYKDLLIISAPDYNYIREYKKINHKQNMKLIMRTVLNEKLSRIHYNNYSLWALAVTEIDRGIVPTRKGYEAACAVNRAREFGITASIMGRPEMIEKFLPNVFCGKEVVHKIDRRMIRYV